MRAAEHGDLDLPTVDGFLDDDPLVVGEGVLDAVAQLLDFVRLGDADRRAHVRRLDEARQTELVGELCRQPRRPLVVAERPPARLRHAVGGEHLLGHRLVHRQRRAEDARADVGDVGELEEALHRAVLAHRPVEQGQDDGRLGGSDLERRLRRHRRPGRVELRRQRRRTRLQRLCRALGERPLAVGGDADRRDAVARRIDRGQDVRRRDAAHVVLGRLPAEQHDEVDPVGRHASTVPFGDVRFRASDVATATGGVLQGADAVLGGASFDSRSLRRGDLFVAVVAERDGHDFVGDAAAAGAGAALVSRSVDVADLPLVIVPETSLALLDLAAWARDGLGATVVGITGSVGKTSTKDFVAAAVGAARRVAANERSFNNEQGLPVTILGAPDDTEVLVLEMGMRGLGEIARLCAVGRPDIGVVTSVVAAHTERVGGIEGVARAKARARRGPARDRHGGAQRRRPIGRGDGGLDNGGRADVRRRRGR